MDERSPRTGWGGAIINKFKAVLFDFDGTLARTMEDNFKAWKAAMSEYGIDIKPEDYYPLEGIRLYEVAKRLFDIYHFEAPDERELVRKKEKYYLENHHFVLYPGVEELIRVLRSKNVRIAVVTAGLPDRLNNSVPPELLEKFDAIVTGDETEEGKPSPAPYLRGAEKLRVRPEDCIVVENAPLGIESAKNAGAYCIAICTTLNKSYLEKADEVLDSFENLKDSETIKQLLE